MKNNHLIGMLISGLIGIGLLWLAFASDTITRAEMYHYVNITSLEHLRLLREDFKGVRVALDDVSQRLAGVEAILRERLEGERRGSART